jgi:hypothetical protein
MTQVKVEKGQAWQQKAATPSPTAWRKGNTGRHPDGPIRTVTIVARCANDSRRWNVTSSWSDAPKAVRNITMKETTLRAKFRLVS